MYSVTIKGDSIVAQIGAVILPLYVPGLELEATTHRECYPTLALVKVIGATATLLNTAVIVMAIARYKQRKRWLS